MDDVERQDDSDLVGGPSASEVFADGTGADDPLDDQEAQLEIDIFTRSAKKSRPALMKANASEVVDEFLLSAAVDADVGDDIADAHVAEELRQAVVDTGGELVTAGPPALGLQDTIL